ncbi:cupin-like domain-containing protein [Lysobacter claricitrinus]|uniref:cupin-like domain-containing protein n=1 Tax=Lysobacter claricitrinus TaxID=3367728 RepID=UPI0037DB9776
MAATAEAIRTLTGADPRALPDDVLTSKQPVLLRGLIRDWPLVQAARRGAGEAIDYLRVQDRGAIVDVMVGPPAIDGRFFYNDDLSGFNFHRERAPLAAMLDAMQRHLDDASPPALYVGSTTIDTALPALRADNDVDLGARDPLASIWIGNRTRIAAHQDVPDNLACVAAGRRRFTLFPPEQLANLYVGPIDFNPAGQAISLVDFAAPDLASYPRFAKALEHAIVVELDAGDAVFIPSLWWHHIEALDTFNVLVNYWWRRSPAWMDSPMNALMLALMTIRDLPSTERDAWRDIFEHYVFAPDADTVDHIPPAARRVLAPLDAATARELRARLLKRLNR